MSCDPELLAEVKAMRAAIEAMRADIYPALRAIAQNTRDLYRWGQADALTIHTDDDTPIRTEAPDA